MRWLLINPIKSAGWGGMEGWMLRLASELAAQGEECAIAGRIRSPWPARCARAGIEFEPLCFGGDAAPWAWLSLARIMRRRRPDVVIVKGFRQARWARLTAPSAAIAVKLPAGGELRDTLADRWTVRSVVDRILTDCHATRAELLRRRWLRPARVVVAYNGVTPISHWPDEALRRRARTVLLGNRSDVGPIAVVVGRLDAAKRVDDVLGAFAAVGADVAARLVVIGDGPDRERIQALVRSFGVQERVELLGWRDDAAELMWGADLLIHASEREGLSNAILEAMAAGLPVVATKSGGTAEAVEDGLTGRLVDCGDRAAMAAAIGELLRDRALASRLGAAGAARVRERFTVPGMVRAIRCAMGEVVALRRRLVRRPVQRPDRSALVEAVPGAGGWLPADGRQEEWNLVKATRRVMVHRRSGGEGTELYAKSFLAVRWRDRVGSWVRRPRAWANYRTAQRLALRGFETVPHLAATWRRGAGGGIESVLLTCAVPNTVRMDVWVRSILAEPRMRRHVAVAAGRWLAALHENWVIPHDLKASNILVRTAPPLDFVLLDLDNCTTARPPLHRDIVRNFAQFRRSFEQDLGFDEWRRFCAAYACARGWSVVRLRRLLLRVERRARRRGMRDCTAVAGSSPTTA
ncbi:MAG: glycosyltransferase [Kiritimatiellae bacterium]|nr:glycosyltransferase [Kiritimatiellia bacterium]